MASDPNRLDGRVAFVTGGAGHLGAAMTRTLARRGAMVVVADLDGDRAREHADAIDGADVMGIGIDVASESSIAAAFAAATDFFGGIDVLVNNAAPSPLIREDAPVGDVALEIFDAIHAVVVRGSLLCARQALPSMIARGGGSIVNISSIHAHAGDTDLTAYPVAKASLHGLTRSIATQYGRRGVRANTLTMGTVPFPQMSAEAVDAKMRHQLVSHQGVPEDAANIVAFLASSASAFMTGSDVTADGGVLAHLPSYADGGTFQIMRT